MTNRDRIDLSWDPLAASQQADQNPDQPVDIPTPQWVISDGRPTAITVQPDGRIRLIANVNLLLERAQP